MMTKTEAVSQAHKMSKKLDCPFYAIELVEFGEWFVSMQEPGLPLGEVIECFNEEERILT
jgi:hypothetical protein